MTRNEQKDKELIEHDSDFILFPRYGNSLRKFLAAHPEGVDLPIIAKVLNLSLRQVGNLLSSALQKLRDKL